MAQDTFKTLKEFTPSPGKTGKYHSLAALEAAGLGKISRLPRSIRVVLEALVRHCDGKRVTEEHVRALAAWQANGKRSSEIPFIVVRIVLQDLIGFGTLNDLSAMRAAAERLGMPPGNIEPLVPVDVVVDHSVEIDVHNRPDAVQINQEIEFKRNAERYSFVKWAQGAFKTVRVVPPGNGIIHQINMEHLSRGVWEKDGVWFPDTVFGTDSHTTMVNGIGVVAWGVGGIEAEAGMLGQPNAFLTPDVVGCHMTGKLREGVTATDLALTVTELMRKTKVVGKFVEYFGPGAAALTAADRCTVANMAPEYGATMGYFPVDEKTVDYFRTTGREPELVSAIEAYYKAQGMFGMPQKGEIDYSQVIELDLDSIVPSLSGPKRPQDRVSLPELGRNFDMLFSAPADKNGYARPAADLNRREPTGHAFDVGHGDVLIASITSCTNTSNPALLLAAGLLAKRAVDKGLMPHPRIKTSLAPGSKVVTAYLRDAGLLPSLEKLGFGVVAYGCTTCMGAAGPLDAKIEEAVVSKDLVTCAVLSGNRNFEARVHANLRANYLASPALVVAYALAGTVRTDLTKDPLGKDRDGKPVYLKDLWPTDAEVAALLKFASNAEHFRREYGDLSGNKKLWEAIPTVKGAVYQWDAKSTFIKEPPFFEGVTRTPGKIDDIRGARALAILGDSITTDHISPSTKIKPGTPAGKWLEPFGTPPSEWGHFGVRRCNHELMVRGTFANVRLRNAVAPGTEGPMTKHQPDGELMTIFDASEKYRAEKTPLVIFGGDDYGMGSSRDWAAKGVQLLGVKAVIVKSFERIHRANLIGMGVLPLQFKPGTDVKTLGIDGTESFSIEGINGGNVKPLQDVTMVITRADGSTQKVPLTLRIDTVIEVDYLKHGGILPYVLRELLAAA
ncbi:MAG: aconitate hydratase AcnA [Burkholderiales bacterium]|jgi:aconitate hydratase|nr:aconitate hydratase AcnA [Burkholderiales bacterium]